MKFVMLKYKKNIRYISVLILLLTVSSFLLPRETFDPHFGFDYDIFCVAYHLLLSADNVIIEIKIEQKKIKDNKKPVLYIEPQVIFICNLSTRAPPQRIAA